MFIFIWLLLVLFSFTQQDLNLTIYNNIFSWLQYLGFYRRPLTTGLFLVLVFLIFLSYFKLLKSRNSWRWLILLIIFALPAYPLFSYDIFNYLFNAKMVLLYHANPHLQTAIEFAFDPMLRFMRNVHTPAPYAYGWTGLSLIPGLAWLTKNFTLSFWAMKLFIAVFWFGQLWILQKLVRRLFPQEQWRYWLFALNPLVLVETLINGHNDVMMMFFALLSYWFFLNSQKFKSILFLIFSASIKYVTILLLPFFWLKKHFDLPTLFSVGLLLVIFTRPGQLHSWYLIWAFSFAVLSKSKWLVKVFTALTIGALLRYAPYLYFGHWDSPVNLIRNLIWVLSLFLAPLVKI